MQSYQSLSAWVYQIDKPIGKSFGDVEYYQSRLQGITGPILEPAVGTGRILIPLLQAGLAVQGFDLSTAMLTHCQNNLKQFGFDSHTVWQDDMTSFQCPQNMAAIIIPTGTFLLLDNEQKAIRALQCCFEQLQSGGKLLIDTCLQHNFVLGQSSSREFYADDEHLITLHTTHADIDYIEQVTTSHHKYEHWHHGKLINSEWEVFRLKWFGVAEFTRLLAQMGFVDISISADYQYLHTPNNQTEVMTFEAYKP